MSSPLLTRFQGYYCESDIESLHEGSFETTLTVPGKGRSMYSTKKQENRRIDRRLLNSIFDFN